MEHSLLDSYRYRLLAGFPLAGLGGAPSVPHREIRAILLCCPSVLYLNFSSGFSSLLGSHLNPSAQKVLWDLVSVSPASFLLPTPRLYAVTLKFIVCLPELGGFLMALHLCSCSFLCLCSYFLACLPEKLLFIFPGATNVLPLPGSFP